MWYQILNSSIRNNTCTEQTNNAKKIQNTAHDHMIPDVSEECYINFHCQQINSLKASYSEEREDIDIGSMFQPPTQLDNSFNITTSYTSTSH